MNNNEPTQKLKQKFKEILGMEERRAKFLVTLLLAIIKFRTVNLTKLVPSFGKKKAETRYKQIQRFFRNYRFDRKLLARFIVSFLWDEPHIVSMDRTNWKYGKVDINILTVGIVYKGIAFPVLWRLLPKRWNSNTQERIDITQEFIDIFGKWSISLFLADREFIWKERVLWLMNSWVEFILRVRNNTKIEGYGKNKHISESFKHDKLYHPRALKRKRKVWGISLYVTWMKTKDEFLIVISQTFYPNAIEKYGMRREIETLFGCVKTRGFCLEETHIQDPERISTMMGVVSLAFVWAHITWEWKEKKYPILIKKHWRKQYSIFRYGLDVLRDIFENVIEYTKEFFMVLRLLSCT